MLHEDDSRLMGFLCVLLHHGPVEGVFPRAKRNTGVILVELAKIADKYQAKEALTGHITAMLAPFANRGGTDALLLPELANLATASYLFGLSDLFSLFTRRMVLDHATYFSEMWDHPFCKTLPASAIRKAYPNNARERGQPS